MTYDGRALVLEGWDGSADTLESVRAALASQGLDARVDAQALRVEAVKD